MLFVLHNMRGARPLANKRAEEKILHVRIKFEPVIAVRTVPEAFDIGPCQQFEARWADEII